MKQTFKKIINLLLILTFFLQPVLIFKVKAETLLDVYNNTNQNINNNSNTGVGIDGQAGVLPPREDTLYVPSFLENNNVNNLYNPNDSNLNPTIINQQIQNSVLSTTAATSSNVNQGNSSANASGITTCLGSQIVAQAIVGAVTSYASGAVSKVTDSLLNVPTSEQGSVGASIKTEASATVGSGLNMFGFSIPTLPSWNSMAYCIVNTMIVYIADSTIQWINTGFEGNPAFLNNPDQFFEDLANQEKIAFLQGLAYGVNSSVCGVFKSSVVSAVLSRYGRNQQQMYGGGQQGYQTGGYGGGGVPSGAMSSCPFDNNPGQLSAFLTGGFTQGGGWDTWFQITQNPMSNPYDTYFNANGAMNSQVQAKQISNERELNWNNGYLSFRKCENGEKDKSKCPITTPGSIIQSKVNETLNLGTNRLVLADKFDQVVTAVVDQLITTAIDKALDKDSYSSSNNYNSTNYNSNINSGKSTNSIWNKGVDPYTGQTQQNQNFASTTNQFNTTERVTGTRQ